MRSCKDINESPGTDPGINLTKYLKTTRCSSNIRVISYQYFNYKTVATFVHHDECI